MQTVAQFAESTWCRLMPAGSVDVQRVYDMADLASYVTKELGRLEAYEAVVLPDAFQDLRDG